MKKIFYKKLVRDKIPDIITARGSQCSTRKMRAQEFDGVLRKKLLEEAKEVCSAKTRQEIITELGDVLDVVEEIKKRSKITDAHIRIAQKISLERKGGFTKRLFLEWSSDDGYKRIGK